MAFLTHCIVMSLVLVTKKPGKFTSGTITIINRPELSWPINIWSKHVALSFFIVKHASRNIRLMTALSTNTMAIYIGLVSTNHRFAHHNATGNWDWGTGNFRSREIANYGQCVASHCSRRQLFGELLAFIQYVLILESIRNDTRYRVNPVA